ncbi:hypothetical protein K439DRAFT_1617897 [Ramaria rubella]|nr:hypothetical protein K439DRAFT_1617897 [Ramaria rubella]
MVDVDLLSFDLLIRFTAALEHRGWVSVHTEVIILSTMSQATTLNPDFVNQQHEMLTKTLLGMPAFVPMAQSINDVSSDGQEASKYERFTDHSSPPPDIYLPMSPVSKNCSPPPPDFHSPTSPASEHRSPPPPDFHSATSPGSEHCSPPPPDFHSPTSPASEHRTPRPPPPDFHSPTSPENEHHMEEGQLRATSSPLCHLSPLGNLANPTDPTNDHWPLSEDLHVLSIQLKSCTRTLLTEDLDNCQSTMILLGVKWNRAPSTYAVLTGFSKECSTVDELISAIMSHLEMQYLSEQLLESFVTGMDYSVLRVREAYAMESLDVWQDRCQVLDKLSTILIRMLSHCDKRNIIICSATAPQTRVPSATLWGFPEMDLLYILYLVPEGPSLSAAPVTSHAPSPWDNQRCAAPSHLLPTNDELPIEGSALELGHTLQIKTGPGSTSVVDGIAISSSDIKKFVMRLQPATFDNNCSHLNKYRRVFAMVTSDSDETYVHNIKVKRFKRLYQELFATNEDTIAMVSVPVGSEVKFEHSVRSKAWGYMNRLKEEVKICLSEGSSFSDNDTDKRETSM